MLVKTQRFLILGVSKSGSAVADYLLDNNSICYLYEELKNPKVQANILRLREKGAFCVDENSIDQVLSQVNAVIISPGVAINHRIAVKAKSMGVKIIGELEFGFLNTMPTIVGVTGTNGKTTTVSLINAILSENKTKSVLVGNVGNPVTKEINNMDKNTVCVTEVSSFQLESVHNFCPHISCILNIAPDHLERHYTMENYVFLKKKILKNQTKTEYAVLNYDDQTVKEFVNDCNATVVFVSLKEKVNGACIQDDSIYFNDEFIINLQDLPLIGEHNIYNSMFAVSVAKLLGVDNQIIRNALISFKGVKHRIEAIKEIGGIKVYNDSKATNTASTISAIKTMKNPTVLILGGSEKGESYDELFKVISESLVKHVIITGASMFNMLDSARKFNYNKITLTEDFFHTIHISKIIAQNGDSILFSPACASFDKFSGYEERGEKFCQEVEKVFGEINA
ncbi:MAG: UDP-N-acetylmuramoyl-L-alanine--D-glutamate ligase [Clostridia bacterium]|nr:UDP-N-acetylmuramoyl-L-alanine--D-glutamate ligase [Clostridia bacterium]